MLFFVILTCCVCLLRIAAFDNTRYDNVAVYWGQNSYGATHTDTANFQKTLSFYCQVLRFILPSSKSGLIQLKDTDSQDSAIDVIPVAFLNVFFGTGGAPSINLANTCNPTDNATFPGTNLPNCAALATDIATCQSKGKLVTLSLGGATGSVGFSSDAQATTFAQTIWNMFLGGSSSTRPFGSAVLDGVDLDIEGGTSAYYATFVNKIRSLASGASKKYYVTAAPQCVYPDASLGAVLNTANFDAIYVQFYNNPCSLPHFGEASNWNFGIWDAWARSISPNPNVKIYIGAPGSSTAAGSGYVDSSTLNSIAVQMRKSFPSFGGVMLWDASQAYVNGRYDLSVKNALVAAGGTGFTYPTCSAPAYVSGNAYTANSQVSFSGYIWQAKWWSQAQPASNANGDWSAISACSGSGGSGSSTTSGTTSSQTPTPTGGSCSGVSGWTSTSIYTAGMQVTYSSHLWAAQWWTQGDTPGGSTGVWTDKGACTSAKEAAKSGPHAAPTTSTPSVTKLSRSFRF